MVKSTGKGSGLSESELQDLVASSDAGSRNPEGSVGLFLAAVALVWSIYQVTLASPLSNYILPSDLINNSRQLHLAFALFLAFMAYPALKSSPRHKIRYKTGFWVFLGHLLLFMGFSFTTKLSPPVGWLTTRTSGLPLLVS